jgi:uncharacterized membrane protein
MRKRIAFPVILAMVVVSAFAQKALVKGTIVDSEGAVVENAYVLIRTDENELGQRVELRTNNKGEFMTSLPSGFYDLFIGAQGFAPYCQKVRTNEGQTQDLRIRVKIDQLMLREHGDEFVTPKAPKTKPSPPLSPKDLHH